MRRVTHLDVGILEELLETVLVHLNGGDVLALLHIDVRNVQPHVAEISSGLAYLQHNNRYRVPVVQGEIQCCGGGVNTSGGRYS
jgi:hypothetical protein